MNLNVLVVTKYEWKSRDRKHAAIAQLMGFPVTFTTLHKNVGKPDVKDGRITQEWFEKNISSLAKGKYTNVVFQFSVEDGKKWKIKSSLNGSNFNDGDGFGETWVCTNEFTKKKMDDGEVWDKYTKTVPHELGHELTRQGYTKLEVHDYDFQTKINRLRQFYMDFNAEQRLARPFTQWGDVSQKYGNVDCVTYPMTCRHVGTDFRTPLDTPIRAPKDCEITRTGSSASMGFWCEVKIDNWYMVCLHLKSEPAKGKVAKGMPLGFVGATGTIKGIHSHIEGWNAPMDRSKLTKENWSTLTFDITSKIQ